MLVDARGERWQVVESIAHDGCVTCRLAGAAASNLGVERALILPFDRPQPIDRRPRWRRVGRRRWVLACRALLASDATAAGLRGAADARLDLLDYQLEPALASARGALRLLLADEVGLGKTVQAGLILADLCARSEWVRALVVCPAGLCAQWQQELADRFGLRSTVVDLLSLRRLFRGAGPEVSAWDRLPLAIASIDFVKQPAVLQGMSQVRWDLLVVDEAHLSAVAPERAAAVDWLARRSRRVALLTATPHPGDDDAFEALCGVGRLPGEGPVLMFRRTRSGLGLRSDRRVRVLSLRPSAPERRMHAALQRYVSRVWRTDGSPAGRADARLAMLVLAKRAASGPAPLLCSLERRLRWLDLTAADAAQLQLPLGEPDQDEADEEPGAVLAAPGLASRSAEIAMLATLIALAQAALPFDGKARALHRLLRRVAEPAIVFTEYRDALERVAVCLPSGVEAVVIHGGLDPRARAEAVRRFTAGSPRVLLATDAAAHGLNLQARCRLVIDLDLPWSPVRLEQRIGRVDRIGQRKVVHAVHLVVRGTSEARVLDRLAAKVACASRTMFDAPDLIGSGIEVALGEAVFGDGTAKTDVGRATGGVSRRGASARGSVTGATAEQREMPPVAHLPFRRVDLSAEARVESARLLGLRQLRARGADALLDVCARLEAASPWWTNLRVRGAGDRCLLALFRGDVVNEAGLLLERLLIPLEARFACGPLPPAAIPLGVLEAVALERAQAALAGVVAGIQPRHDAERAREDALAGVVDAVPLVAVQAGLFDRRALRDAEAARAGRASLGDDTAARLDLLRLAAAVKLAGPPRLLLAAWTRGA
jgi:superfamily II DNA or RNA helicase